MYALSTLECKDTSGPPWRVEADRAHHTKPPLRTVQLGAVMPNRLATRLGKHKLLGRKALNGGVRYWCACPVLRSPNSPNFKQGTRRQPFSAIAADLQL